MKRENKNSSSGGTLGLSMGGALKTGPRASSKYSRACKDNAKALVALVVADENFKFDKTFGKTTTHSSANSSGGHGAGLSSRSRSSGSRSKILRKTLGSHQYSMQAEKLRLLCENVTSSGAANYVCLTCNSRQFTDYAQLTAHHSQNPLCVRQWSMMGHGVHSSSMSQPLSHRRLPSSLDSYLSGSLKSVPESSLNFLDGRICQLKTLDGVYLKRNPKIRTVNRVKLNLVVGPWDDTLELWRSASGEGGLSWEATQPHQLDFLKSLSVFGWNEQFLLKKSFTHWLKSGSNGSGGPVNSGDAEPRRSSKRLLNHLQLTSSHYQVSSSSKQMNRGVRRLPAASPSVFSGEWELDRTYICSVCSSTFDDLEEVMHHKWEDHPYCLVSHWSLTRSTGLPPSGMYPQCVPSNSPKHAGPQYNNNAPDRTCSLCQKSFQDPDNFYVHLLSCGESHEGPPAEASWSARSPSSGRRRRKRSSGVLRSINGSGKSLEELRQVERERRKRRLEAFSKPRPLSQRLTTLRSRSSLPSSPPNAPAPLPRPPLVVSGDYEPEVIRDVFNPGELFVKSLLMEVLEKVLLPASSNQGSDKARRSLSRSSRRRKGGQIYRAKQQRNKRGITAVGGGGRRSLRKKMKDSTSADGATMSDPTPMGDGGDIPSSVSRATPTRKSTRRRVIPVSGLYGSSSPIQQTTPPRRGVRSTETPLRSGNSRGSSSPGSSSSSTMSPSSSPPLPSSPPFFARKSCPDEAVFYAVKSAPLQQRQQPLLSHQQQQSTEDPLETNPSHTFSEPMEDSIEASLNPHAHLPSEFLPRVEDGDGSHLFPGPAVALLCINNRYEEDSSTAGTSATNRYPGSSQATLLGGGSSSSSSSSSQQQATTNDAPPSNSITSSLFSL